MLLHVGFDRVAYIASEDQDNKRSTIDAVNLSIEFLDETCTPTSEHEMALANKYTRKQAEDEEHKARKDLDDMTNLLMEVMPSLVSRQNR